MSSRLSAGTVRYGAMQNIFKLPYRHLKVRRHFEEFVASFGVCVGSASEFAMTNVDPLPADESLVSLFAPWSFY